eukprot:jgi/Hompol1/1469/HPOL_000345-RA
MSHRGGSLEHVENTLPGFRFSAQVLKADLLEMDVQLTRDGHVVIFHDDTLERMCGPSFKGRSIPEFDLAQLPPLLIPEKLKHLPHVVNNPESTRIPLLFELLSEFPQYPMQIDVKRGSEELVLKVGNLLQQFNRQDKTVWGSGLTGPSELCFKHFGTSIPLFFSASRLLRFYFCWSIGVPDWFELRESALIMPNYAFLMRKSFIKALNERGVSVIVFGGDGSGSINDEQGWMRVLEVGANGICSDCPTMLARWLEKHPLPVCNWRFE